MGYEFRLMRRLGRKMAQRGSNTYLFTQPYHSERTPEGYYSGELALSSDLAGTVEAIRQSVCDVRALISYIRSKTEGPLILTGTSLGGFVTCLIVAVDDRIDFAIPVITGNSLSDAVYNTPLDKAVRNELIENGVDFERTKSTWRIVQPGNFQPLISKDRILLIAGKYDPLVRPQTVTELWQQWKEPDIIWLESAHISNLLIMDKVLDKIDEWLQKNQNYS